MNEILNIKIITLGLLGLSVIILLCWIYRPKSKELYDKLSKIPIRDSEEK